MEESYNYKFGRTSAENLVKTYLQLPKGSPFREKNEQEMRAILDSLKLPVPEENDLWSIYNTLIEGKRIASTNLLNKVKKRMQNLTEEGNYERVEQILGAVKKKYSEDVYASLNSLYNRLRNDGETEQIF